MDVTGRGSGPQHPGSTPRNPGGAVRRERGLPSGRRPGPARLTWIGHSTVLVDLDGVRLLTDPLLRDRVPHLRRQVPGVLPEKHTDVDAVLVSHLHLDHLDLPSLRLAGRDTPVIVPRGGGRLLRSRGFGRVAEMEAGEELRIGALGVRATHAEHGGARSPLGARVPALGYVFAGSHRVYFAGDTGIFEGMARIAPGTLDVALLPVGGWGPLAPLWERLPFPIPGHLDPRRAAEALRLVRPLLAVPIHWGTYAPPGLGRAMPGCLKEPPQAFRRHAAELAPEVEVRVLSPGGSLQLGPFAAADKFEGPGP